MKHLILFFIFYQTLFSQAIFLQEESIVKGFQIYLKDIAKFNDKQLENIIIGNTPELGEKFTYSRQEIEYIIKKEFPKLNINWSGASFVKIETKILKITPQELIEMAREFIKINHHGNIELKLINKIESPIFFKAPRKNISITPKLNSNIKKYLDVIISIIVDGCLIKEIKLRFSFEIFKKVILSNTYIPRNTILNNSHLSIQKKNMSSDLGNYFSTFNEIIGKKVKKNIVKGKIITTEDIEEIPVIYRGKVINLFIKKDNLSIILKVKALEDGKKGELIRVLNLYNKKIIKAFIFNQTSVILTK